MLCTRRAARVAAAASARASRSSVAVPVIQVASNSHQPPKRPDWWKFEVIQSPSETKARVIDQYNRHQQILPMTADFTPQVARNAFVAPSATLIGNVEVWDHASVWYNCTVKGDVNLVRIGAYTNIQEDTVIEESLTSLGPDHDGSTIIGHYVTVGHRCVLRACTVEDECLVGMGSVLEEGSYMETNSILGAGSVLTKGSRVGSGELWVGNPATKKRKLMEDEIAELKKGAERYRIVANEHADVFFLPGHAYLDAEKHGIEVGWKETPGQ